MKSKIKDIALEVGGSHYPEVGGRLLEEFAEQIIKECIAAVQATDRTHVCTTYDLGLVVETISRSVNSIKERFNDSPTTTGQP